MKGYWNKPDATTEVLDADGWFRTGDMAHVDDDGYFFIVDRKKDMIIRGGYNVYPREIEEVLYEHPAVAEAAVDRHPATDSRARRSAPPSCSRTGEDVDADELRDYVKERVANYKYPRRSGSPTSCRRARRARSSSARSRSPTPSRRELRWPPPPKPRRSAPRQGAASSAWTRCSPTRRAARCAGCCPAARRSSSPRS